MVTIDPGQQPVPACLAAGQQLGQFGPALADQPGADMAATFVGVCLTVCPARLLNRLFGDLFFAAGCSQGEFLDGPSAAVAGGKIRPGIDSGGIPAHYLFHPADVLEHIPPVQQGELAQTGEGVAAGKLFSGLTVLLPQTDVVERVLEDTFEPAPDRRQGRILVIEQAGQLGPEIRTGLRLGLGQFRQNHEELVGTVTIGSCQPVGPEIGQLAFAQVLKGGDGETLDVFDQGDAQHLGNSPQFSDGQGSDGLVGLDEGQDILPV